MCLRAQQSGCKHRSPVRLLCTCLAARAAASAGSERAAANSARENRNGLWYAASARRRPPNPRMHPTPLRVVRDRGVFERWFHATAFPIYQCGAGDAQDVGWQPYRSRSRTMCLLLPAKDDTIPSATRNQLMRILIQRHIVLTSL